MSNPGYERAPERVLQSLANASAPKWTSRLLRDWILELCFCFKGLCILGPEPPNNAVLCFANSFTTKTFRIQDVPPCLPRHSLHRNVCFFWFSNYFLTLTIKICAWAIPWFLAVSVTDAWGFLDLLRISEMDLRLNFEESNIPWFKKSWIGWW